MLKLVGEAAWNRRCRGSSLQFARLPELMKQGNFLRMTFEVCREIGADHPSLPGHFPDTPLVPGVVILDEVFAALLEWRKGCRLIGIRSVKFLVPLKPERPFTICFSARDDDASEVNFWCRGEDRIIVEGRLEVCWEPK